MKATHYLYFIPLLAGMSCANPKKSAPPTTPDGTASLDTSSRVIPEPAPANSVSASESTASPRTGTWVYKETVGETGLKAYTASVTSADLLTFEKPFDGGATATLTARRRSGSTTVSLSVSKGQFTSSFQGGQVRIRFDDGASTLYSFTPASNGNTDIIFLEPVEPLIRKLKAAGKVVMNVSFYGQGTRTINFRTAGLRWKD